MLWMHVWKGIIVKMNNSRTKNTVFNLIANIGGQGASILLRFISRTVFIYVLGKGYLGINGLFSNILEILSLAELGVGTAIIYSMYEPLAKKDLERLAALTNYYKILYRKIAGIVFTVGILLVPFLDDIVNLNQDEPQLYLFYILSLLNTTFSYFCVYKTSILTADQKEYKLKIYRTIFQFVQVIAQIVVLILFKSYLIYMITQIICLLCSNIWTAQKASKLYPDVNSNREAKLSREEKRDMWTNIRAMFSYKIGGVLMNNTDQILISTLINTETVGLYSNYLMVTQSLTSIMGMAFTSVRASIGNLATEKKFEKEYEIFKVLELLAFWIFGGGAIGLAVLFNDFISLWVGKSYLLDEKTVLVIGLSFYIAGVVYPILCYRETVGLFKQTKNILFYSSIINLVLSVILGNIFGLVGILLATVIARICTNVWYEPYKLYKSYFKKPFGEYFLIHLKDVIVIVVLAISAIFTIGQIDSGLILLDLITKFILLFIALNIIFFIYKYEDIKNVKKYIVRIFSLLKK